MKRTALTLLILAFVASAANAAIIGISTGTAAPPAALGGVPISAFNESGLPLFSTLTVPLFHPATGVLATLSTPAAGPPDVRRIGMGWATWSHGYTGEVYYGQGSETINVVLSGGVDAFLVYAEPNPFQLFTMTATAQDGTSLTQIVDGSGGAAGFGFYGTDGSQILSVTITGGAGPAIGELYAGSTCCGPPAPEPSSLLLLGLGLIALIGFGWRHGRG